MVKPIRLVLYATTAVAAVAAIALVAAPAAGAHAKVPARLAGLKAPGSQHFAINCAYASAMCTEVANSDEVFGHYVGHDEPSVLFDSNVSGSGNHMSYNVTLPSDPSASNPNAPGKSYNFELSGASWFGMAMCDTQSYPELVSTCPADSNKNILDPVKSPNHVGQAYMEMQFYPPGWIQWPTWALAVGASSCDPTHWCAAMNIDSLALNPVTGQTQNAGCQAKVGEEYINFAFITKNGQSTGPANPVDSTIGGTFTPDPSRDLFMNSGDNLKVAFKDTPDGLKVTINDLTTGQSGSMTASPANGFAEVKWDPNGTSCTAIPYAFHPMYSTSTTKTRVTWAAGSYNVAFDTEIGHFQYCNGPVPIPSTEFGVDSSGNVTTCPAGDQEGQGASLGPPDGDDFFCFPGSEAPTYHVNGCTYTNTGFDGVSYQSQWPDGNTALHPTSFQFSSPMTGPHYNIQYKNPAFETDLPAIESTCDPVSGAGCTLIPTTDTGQPAAFYPFYTTSNGYGGCYWEIGNNIPGQISNFGENNQYGSLLAQSYTQLGGGAAYFIQDFKNILSKNPCPQG